MKAIQEVVDQSLADAEKLWGDGRLDEARRALFDAAAQARAERACLPLAKALSARMQIELADGETAAAADAARQMLEALGELDDARYVANGTMDAANQFEQAGATEIAKELLHRGIAALEKAGDARNAATLWNNLGLLLTRLADTEGAVAAMERAADGYRALGAAAAPNLEKALRNLIALHRRRFDRGGRRRCLEELLTLVRAQGAGLRVFVELLGDLMSARAEGGDLAAARATAAELEKLLVIGMASEPDGHARALALVAATLREVGLDAEAAARLRAALGLLEPGSVGWVAVANNLARVLEDTGDVGEARRLYDDVVARAVTAGGDALAATAYRNRAAFRGAIGDLDGAIEDADLAVEHQRRVQPEDPAELAAVLLILGQMLLDAGRGEAAARAVGESERLRSAGGTPTSVHELRNRGFAALALGRHQEAEALLVMASGQASAQLGPRHPMVAATATDLSTLALRRGRATDAENTARRALRILDEARPGLHFDRARALACLARAQATLGKHDEALATAEEMERTDDALMGYLFAAAPDRQRTRFAAKLREDFETFLSVWLAAPPAEGRAARALERVLRRKGLGVEVFARQQEQPSPAGEHEALRILRRQAAQAMLESGSTDGAALTARLEALEAEVAGATPGPAFAERLHRITVAEVERCLPPGSALVEIVRARITDYRRPTPDAPAPSSVRYLAFVLRADAPGAAGYVDLGEAGPIDDAVASLVGEGRPAAARGVEAEAAGATTSFDEGMARLGDLVWAPLAAKTTGCTTVFLATDGPLSLVPLDLVPTPDGRWALDTVCFAWLTSGRDMLRWPSAAARSSTPPLVLGDPDFDLTDAAPPSGARRRGRWARCGSFRPLPGARGEALDVATLLGVEPLTGAAATKDAVLAARAPAILHLATHGFVLPAPRDAEPSASGPLAAALDNPMLRAGLALAGANAWLAGGEPAPPAGNGILTAEEVTALDLRGTELVVLSACNTGAGTVDAAEGVYGLRRAVAMAGAERLVVSSWSVPDQATRDLMVTLYEALRAGQGSAEALRAAKQATRARHPKMAAIACGFMFIGNPAPLGG